MPFQKKNKEWMKQPPEKPKTTQWNNIVGWLVGEGGMAYQSLIAKQAKGEEIKKPQQEFMNRFETLLEFHAPKLARQEVKQEIKVESLVNEKQAKTILDAINSRD